MRLFLDSSALAKRYVAEPGTEKIVSLCAEADEILLSIICVPELISAFNRLKREGHLSSRHYGRLKKELAADIEQASIIELTPEILKQTTLCLESARLRTLDAIHVASAQASLCDLFVTADHRQHEAAGILKLTSERIG